jgi:aspartate/methionine/tyrosine aminotransferase
MGLGNNPEFARYCSTLGRGLIMVNSRAMDKLPEFKLERYFGQWEFRARHLLSPSDCESISVAELLALADADGARRWRELRLGYTESQGHPALRAEIAGGYATIAVEQVLVAVPEEAIFIAMQALLAPGQHVITVHPAYQSLYDVARATGCAVSPWPIRLRPDGAGWTFDLDELAGLIRPETRLLVLNFPHNPTGYLPDAATLHQILDLASRHGLLVFSDEMYRGLELAPAARLPAVCDLYENSVSLSGLSKAYGLPGLRLGWLASHVPGFIPACLQIKDFTTICHSGPSEVLGLIALRAGDRLLARNLALVQHNAALADNWFSQRAALFQWLRPQAGSIAFPAWRGPGAVEALCQAALDHEGLMVVPGSIFDFPGPHFRVGLGRQSFPEALVLLARVAEGLAE